MVNPNTKKARFTGLSGHSRSLVDNEMVEAAGNVYTYIKSNYKLLTHCF